MAKKDIFSIKISTITLVLIWPELVIIGPKMVSIMLFLIFPPSYLWYFLLDMPANSKNMQIC